jgi:hypothetical protein
MGHARIGGGWCEQGLVWLLRVYGVRHGVIDLQDDALCAVLPMCGLVLGLNDEVGTILAVRKNESTGSTCDLSTDVDTTMAQ